MNIGLDSYRVGLPEKTQQALNTQFKSGCSVGKREIFVEILKLLNEHTKKAYLTCDENCFCWEIQKFVEDRLSVGEKR